MTNYDIAYEAVEEVYIDRSSVCVVERYSEVGIAMINNHNDRINKYIDKFNDAITDGSYNGAVDTYKTIMKSLTQYEIALSQMKTVDNGAERDRRASIDASDKINELKKNMKESLKALKNENTKKTISKLTIYPEWSRTDKTPKTGFDSGTLKKLSERDWENNDVDKRSPIKDRLLKLKMPNKPSDDYVSPNYKPGETYDEYKKRDEDAKAAHDAEHAKKMEEWKAKYTELKYSKQKAKERHGENTAIKIATQKANDMINSREPKTT